jgi:hypothetical protein
MSNDRPPNAIGAGYLMTGARLLIRTSVFVKVTVAT